MVLYPLKEVAYKYCLTLLFIARFDCSISDSLSDELSASSLTITSPPIIFPDVFLIPGMNGGKSKTKYTSHLYCKLWLAPYYSC